MNPDELRLTRIMFRNRVHTSDGKAYQDLFTTIMQHAYKDFEAIKPQGKFGDRKNDGFIKNEGKYFQVYAPENLGGSVHAAIKKAKDDFQGLKQFWDGISPVRKYYFVLNDKFQGTRPEIEKTLSDLKKDYGLEESTCFTSKHLEDILFDLPEDVIYTIVGGPPNPERIETLDFSVLAEVVTHILGRDNSEITEPSLSAPDFDKKLEFNGLSRVVASILQSGTYHTATLEEYLENNGVLTKTLLRDELNKMYREISEENKEETGDYIFFALLERASPNKRQYVRDATSIILSFFFESCDIFEEPK